MELDEVASILEGTGEPGIAELSQKKTLERKPKKRRRGELKGEICDGSGNSSDNLIEDSCYGEVSEEAQMKDGMIHEEFSETLKKECGLDGNSTESVPSNGNLNENVCFDGLNANVSFDGHLEKNACIDVNLKAGDHSVGSAEETRMKEHVFNVNLGFHQETQIKESGVDGDFMEIASFGAAEETQVKGSSGFNEHVMEGAFLRTDEGIQNEDRDLGGDSKGNASGVFEVAHIKDSSSAKIHSKASGSDDGSGLGSPEKEAYSCKKRRKLSENLKSTKETVLRRSTRRMTYTVSSLNHVSSTEESPAVNVSSFPNTNALSDWKSVDSGTQGLREQSDLPPKLELPPSSKTLNVDEIPILDLFSVYAFLRSFSTLLFLSPFDLEAFVAALKYKFPNSLIDSIHFSILQTLKLHLEFLSDEGSQSASDCLRSLNWGLLDLITWPVYMVEYLLIRGLGLKPGFELSRLDLLNGDYYKQPPAIKVEILRCLCDDVTEAEAIRLELNRRTLASELDMDVDRIANIETYKKRKEPMDDMGGSCLTQEVVLDETTDWNSDECCLCKMDGSLICCDGCPAAYHSRCVGIAKGLLPEGDWYCPECLINKHELWMTLPKSLRGAELLGIDPQGRLYFGSCGYLLVSDSCETESSYYFYHRNDLNAVIEVLKSSYILYGGIISAISTNWGIPVDSTGAKGYSASQTHTIYTDLDVEGQISAIGLSSLPHSDMDGVKGEAIDERKPSKISFITEGLDHPICKVSESVRRFDSATMNQFTEIASPFASSEGSTEISQAATGIQMSHKTGANCSNRYAGTANESEIPEKNHSTAGEYFLMPNDSNVKQENNIGSAVPGRTSSVMNSGKGAASQMQFEPGYYVNHYSFAQTAASVAEELMRKSSDSINKDSKRSDEEIITAQMKAISKNSTNFCWSNIQRLHMDAQKENCGWCFFCKSPNDSSDCLFNMTEKKLAPEGSKSGAVGSCIKRNRKSHLSAVIFHILSIEERLSGLLSGPWHNPHYSKNWRKSVLKASDVASLKHLLLTLESNLRRVALSAEWLKQVDSIVTMGSASHVSTRAQVSYSKHGGGRKRTKFSDAESNCATNAATRSGIFWWRGGRISRQLFHWKVLPRFLALKGARQAGCIKIPGILYPESSEFAKRSKYIAWRAAVEMSTSVTQFACQVRELDTNIRWDDLENSQVFSQLAKESRKLMRPFKKVIIRRKCIEGTNVKYLLDFGKRKIIPDTVIRHGVMLEVSASERKKYWLDESHVPLNLLKAFEEKKLVRMSNKTNTAPLHEGGEVMKNPSKKRGLSYLLSKGEKSETYQCGHCNQDVLVREAVNCQDCKGFFHLKHFRKSKGSITSECTYKCHKCQNKKHVKKTVKIKTKKGKLRLQKSKKASTVVRPRRLAKKVKYGSPPCKNRGGAKKGKQVQSKKGTSKKSKKRICWHKEKRTHVYHAYWLNGLLLTRKPSDARVTHFRERNLLLPSEHSNALFMQPICCLCCEAGYTSRLIYVRCDSCQEWFHGDAFGLAVENSCNIIGFRCHRCRKRNPPVCPYLQDAVDNEIQLRMEKNNAGIECVKEVPEIDKFLTEKFEEHRFPKNECSQGSMHRYKSVPKEQKADTIPDSILEGQKACQSPDSQHKEQKADEIPYYNQSLLLKDCKIESEKDLESSHKEHKVDVILDSIYKDQKADAIPDSNQTCKLEEVEVESRKSHIIAVGSLSEARYPSCKSDEDAVETGLKVLEHHKVKDGLEETTGFPELLVPETHGVSTELHPQITLSLTELLDTGVEKV